MLHKSLPCYHYAESPPCHQVPCLHTPWTLVDCIHELYRGCISTHNTCLSWLLYLDETCQTWWSLCTVISALSLFGEFMAYMLQQADPVVEQDTVFGRAFQKTIAMTDRLACWLEYCVGERCHNRKNTRESYSRDVLAFWLQWPWTRLLHNVSLCYALYKYTCLDRWLGVPWYDL